MPKISLFLIFEDVFNFINVVFDILNVTRYTF